MSSRTQRNGRPEGHKSIVARIREIDSWRLQEGDGFQAISPGDTVIDTLGDGLQRLYFVTKDGMDQAEAKIRQLVAELNGLRTEHQRLRRAGYATPTLSTLTQNRMNELERQISTQERAYETGHSLFWNTVKVEYPIALEAKALTIRDGWVLVSTPEPASRGVASLGALLESIFGGATYGRQEGGFGDSSGLMEMLIISADGRVGRA